MRRMIAGSLILILWGTVTVSAQLPPEILADSYLLRGEKAIEEGDPTRARAEIDKILDLQKEHELDLADEFHFRYAKAAATVGLPEQAHEAVVKYLTLAGREGRHYVEALELMNQAQEAIEARQETQAASSAQSLPEKATNQEAVEAEREAGGTTVGQKEQGAPPPPGCEEWNTKEFFETATAESVTGCLAAGADVAARTEYGYTPLHRAASYSEDPDIVQALLARGADANASNNYGATPLHGAAYGGSVEVFRALLEAGADIEARSAGSLGLTVMHQAAAGNEDAAMVEAVAELLIEAGVDPMEPSAERDISPLHLASRNNENPAVIEALLAAGADLMARAKNGSTPLHWAAEYNENPDVIEVLLAAGADVTARTGKDYTPLHWAARYNDNPAVIEALLAAGAEVNAWSGVEALPKAMPLHQAARWNENPAVIEVLIAAGAATEAPDVDGYAPVHYAAQFNKNPSVLEALFAAGADRSTTTRIKVTEFGNSTLLHLAASSNENPAVVEALLKAGADVAASADFGLTALHAAAAYNENPEIIEVLIAAGADVNAQMTYSGTPLHLAADDNENPAVVEALLKAGADPMLSGKSVGIAWHEAASNENPAVLEKLMAAVRGAGLDPVAMRDRSGSTVLHHAASSGNLAATEALLERSADPRARTVGGSTPLHSAAGTGRGEKKAVIALLAKSGADVNTRDEDGDTPLHIAAARYLGDVSEALLAVGADVNAVDQEGNMPLHRAAEYLSRFPGLALGRARSSGSDAIEALLTAGANAHSRNADRKTPWDILQAGEDPEMKKSDSYWKLNEARFNAPTQRAAPPTPAPAQGPGSGVLCTGMGGTVMNCDGSPIAAVAASSGRDAYLGRDCSKLKSMSRMLCYQSHERARKCPPGMAVQECKRFLIGACTGLKADAESYDYQKYPICKTVREVWLSESSAPPSPSGSTIAISTESCEVPGYPRPSNPQGLGLSWCPASVDFQVRVFALMAAGAKCAIALGNSSTPDQIKARRDEIEGYCERLAALDERLGSSGQCRCPAGYGGP